MEVAVRALNVFLCVEAGYGGRGEGGGGLSGWLSD